MAWSSEPASSRQPTWGGGHPPPGGYLPPLPPELKPKTGRTIAIAVVSVLAVVGIGVGSLVAFFVVTTDASRAKAGDCIDFVVENAPKAGEQTGDAFAQKIGCEDEAAAYEVGVRLDNPTAACPSDVYAYYFQQGGPLGKVKLCLIPNVSEGDCFVESPTKTDKFACARGKRADAIKVLRVVDGAADESRCADLTGDDVYALAYPTPPTTICFSPFGPSTATGPGHST
ncbi:MAG TPA: hypothetical protein VMZ00_12955 [Sporichthya sp.]|nr:hypothetical protein [Sporichthya sp.]